MIHPDGHGLAKRLSGATEWESLLNGFSILSQFHCDRFMNSTSQPLQNGSCDFDTFFDISTKWFIQKTTFDII